MASVRTIDESSPKSIASECCESAAAADSELDELVELDTIDTSNGLYALRIHNSNRLIEQRHDYYIRVNNAVV